MRCMKMEIEETWQRLRKLANILTKEALVGLWRILSYLTRMLRIGITEN